MREILKAGLVVATVLSASLAQAGGPVLIEEGNNELIEEAPTRQIGILPLLGFVVLVGLLASGGDGGGAGDTPSSGEPIDPKVFPQE